MPSGTMTMQAKTWCPWPHEMVLFNDQNITSLNRRPHLSKDINWQGGGFFKYYTLEQYEDTLRNMRYKDDQISFLTTEIPLVNISFCR